MGRPSKPPDQRINRHPLKYPWKPAPEAPWSGPIPDPPAEMTEAAQALWQEWFTSWWSGHLTASDVAPLRQALRLFDKIERNHDERGDRAEYRQLAKSYGLSPEGRNSLHWEPPKERAAAPASSTPPAKGKPRLHVVDKAG